MAKRQLGARVKTERQVSLREALELICATDDGGRAGGHWHGVSLKIARAALFGHPVELWSKDWEAIRRNVSPNATEIIPLTP